jgi:hypothetical protein
VLVNSFAFKVLNPPETLQAGYGELESVEILTQKHGKLQVFLNPIIGKNAKLFYNNKALFTNRFDYLIWKEKIDQIKHCRRP